MVLLVLEELSVAQNAFGNSCVCVCLSGVALPPYGASAFPPTFQHTGEKKTNTFVFARFSYLPSISGAQQCCCYTPVREMWLRLR